MRRFLLLGLLTVVPVLAQTPTCTVYPVILGPESSVFANVPVKPTLSHVWVLAKCTGLLDPTIFTARVTVWITFKTTNAGDQRKGYTLFVKEGIWAEEYIPMLPEETFSSADQYLEFATKIQPVEPLK